MTAPHKPAGASPGKSAIAIMLLCALIALSGFIFSPWHRHNSAGRQACVFSPVEACWMLEAGFPVQVPPVLSVLWITCVRAARLPLARLCPPRFGRAPPVRPSV